MQKGSDFLKYFCAVIAALMLTSCGRTEYSGDFVRKNQSFSISVFDTVSATAIKNGNMAADAMPIFKPICS